MTEDQIRLLSDIFSNKPTTPAPSISEVPVVGRTILEQKMQDTLREREDARQLALEKEFAARPISEKLSGAAESAKFIGSTVARSVGQPFAELYGRATGQPGLGKTFAEGAKLPESDLGLEYTIRFGDAMEPVAKAMEASKIPDITPGMLTAPVRVIDEAAAQAARAGQQVARQATQRLSRMPVQADLIPLFANRIEDAAPSKSSGVQYATKQEGPFYRVSPEGVGATTRGNKEKPGTSPTAAAGAVRGDVSQPITDAQVNEVISTPDNFVRSVVSQYTQDVTGRPYELTEMAPSSITKQAPIGRTFMLAASDNPQYKSNIFEAYGRAMPEAIEQSGARNYDELVEASYRQLATETDNQFKRLPVSMSFHRGGEGNYDSSQDMLRDVYGNRHLYVFQGGDPHPFLNKVDPITGLSDNEKFRAVHDFFGHAIHGNQFGPRGEETAWLAHSQMYSPLARLAMTTETRGQNSVVNYTPLNVNLKTQLADVEARLYEARRLNQKSETKELESLKKDLFNEFQYAPQKGLLLPLEMTSPNYSGEIPGYVRNLIEPDPTTLQTQNLTHFSRVPDLTQTDPKMYGTGIKGAEAQRLADAPDIRPRTFFYTGENPRPEVGLGPYRYGAQADLYDLSADPLQFKALAQESLRQPVSSRINPGIVNTEDALTAAERILRDYGYPGYVVPEANAAAVFSPVPVQRYAKGGAVKAAVRAAEKAKEGQKMLQGVYRGYTGDRLDEPVLSTTPQRRVAEYYANRRSVERGEDPHVEMLMVDPSVGKDYGLSIPIDRFNRDIVTTRAKALAPEDVVERTQLKKSGGQVSSEMDLLVPLFQKGGSAIKGAIAAGKAAKEAQKAKPPKVKQTVKDPVRVAFPGIYQRPDVIAAQAASQVAPESPALKQLFGVTRQDLADIAKSRQGNLPGTLPGAAANPRGSEAASQIMTRANEQRILDAMSEAEKYPELVTGMDPWYVMDPLYQLMVKELGPEMADQEYRKMNILMGMASPGSEVTTEIPRGTAAYYLQKQGRFPEFEELLGMPASQRGPDFPQDIRSVPGHMYHSTAQAIPMRKYLESGKMEMTTPKVPLYIEASGVPEIGFQTQTPVGDAHWSRATGLADVRGAKQFAGSVTNPEMTQLAPWWRKKIAGELGIEPVSAQARAWGTFAPQTGVTTPIGSPKLELLADQAVLAGQRMGISAEEALKMFIIGEGRLGKKKGGAVRKGGLAALS